MELGGRLSIQFYERVSDTRVSIFLKSILESLSVLNKLIQQFFYILRPLIPISFEPILFCFPGFLTMLQPLLKKAYISSVAGHMIPQQVTELQSLPNTRMINGTMLEASNNQDTLMVRSHLVH